jgi:hypothetical protein
MKNDELTELLGYPASKQQRLLILQEIKESGLSIGEVADKYAMPPIFIPDDNGLFDYNGELISSEEFSKRFPHRRFVVLKTKD